MFVSITATSFEQLSSQECAVSMACNDQQHHEILPIVMPDHLADIFLGQYCQTKHEYVILEHIASVIASRCDTCISK